MPYAPGVSYQGANLLYDSLQRSSKQFNDFLAGFLMPNKPTGPVDDPNAPSWDAMNAGGGPQRQPGATTSAPKASILDRFSAGAASSLEGFDRFKQDSDESNALEKLLKTMYPDKKTQIDTMSLGEKRGMLQADQVQKAQSTVQQQALVRMLQAQTAMTRAKTAQTAEDAKANKTPFSPEAGTRTIKLANGSTIEIPFITTSTGGAKSLDELVPNNPKYPDRNKPVTIGQPPSNVKPPSGWDWIWNGKDWVMSRKTKTGGGMSLFPESGGDGAGPIDPKGDPLGLFTQ